MPPRLKGVLFDLDDTLIDWSGVHVGWREIEAGRLERVHAHIVGHAQPPPFDSESLTELYLRRTRAAWDSARTTLRAPHQIRIMLSVLAELGADVAAISVDELIRVYHWDAVPGTAVFPDVPPLLALLRSKNLKLGIVTNASQPMALRDAELATHGLLEAFPDCRVSAADAGYLKPHPLIFETALAEIGARPEETVFVGDNPIADIAGARAVGMRAIHRQTDRAIVSGELAPIERSLRSFAQLPAILDEWYPGWRNGSA